MQKRKTTSKWNIKHRKKTIRNKWPSRKREHQTKLKKKSELNNIIDNKINGILIRSKANKIEYNEKNSKYFATNLPLKYWF